MLTGPFFMPSYLWLRGNQFYFRIAVPKDLREILKRFNYSISLRTTRLPDAKRLSLKCAAFMHGLFNRMQNMLLYTKRGRELVELEDVDRIVRGYLESMVKEAEIDRATRVIDSVRPLNYDEVDDYIDTCTMLISNAKEQLGTGDYERAKKSVDKYIAENDLEIDKSSVTYGLLCREFLRADVVFYQREIDETLGKVPLGATLSYPKTSTGSSINDAEIRQPKSSPKSVVGSTRTRVNSEVKDKKKDLRLSEVLDAYIAYKQELGDWREGTTQDIIPVLREFVEILDDPHVSRITRETLRVYEMALSRLPSNSKKKPQYRERTIKEVLKMDIPQKDKISHQTIKNKISKVNSFLAWGYEKSGTLPDWASKIIAAPRAPLVKESQQRNVFSKEDLEKLFDAPGYTADNLGFKKSAHFWLPLLGLFTGARLEELAQLYLEDFREIDGIWCIDINETEDGDKQVKNTNAIRVIPIHPVLLDLGIINRVEYLRGQGKDRLFEELKKRQRNDLRRLFFQVVRSLFAERGHC